MKSHGHKSGGVVSRTYASWQAMKTRVSSTTRNTAKHYVDRGITCCERWSKFDNFLADMGERPADMTLDRIDNDGNYEPSNCRWATTRTQGRNTRRNVLDFDTAKAAATYGVTRRHIGKIRDGLKWSASFVREQTA